MPCGGFGLCRVRSWRNVQSVVEVRDGEAVLLPFELAQRGRGKSAGRDEVVQVVDVAGRAEREQDASTHRWRSARRKTIDDARYACNGGKEIGLVGLNVAELQSGPEWIPHDE